MPRYIIFIVLYAGISLLSHGATVPVLKAIKPASIGFGQPAAVKVSVADTAESGLRLSLVPGGPYQRSVWPLQNGGLNVAVYDDRFIIAAGASGLLSLTASTPDKDQINTLLSTIDSRMLKIDNGYAYVISSSEELLIIDIASNARPEIRGRYELPEPVSDFVVNAGRAYLLINQDHISVLDVRHPSDIRVMGEQRMEQVTTRIFAANGFLYAATSNGLAVLNVSDTSRIAVAGHYHLNDEITALTGQGEYIFIAGHKRGLTIVDVSDPTTPRWIASHHRLGDIAGMVIDDEHALVRSSSGLFTLVDISMPEMPTIISSYRLMKGIIDFALHARTAVVTTAEQVISIDFSPLPPPLSNELLDVGQGVNYGGQRRAFVEGPVVYVADWFSGIHIYDVSDNAHPRLLSSFHTPGSPKGIVVRNGIAYVADDDHGLQVIDVHEPRYPRWLGNLPVNGLAYTPKIVGDRLYLASHRGGLQIVDISDPIKPRLLGEVDTPGKAWSIEVRDNIAYIADDDSGLLVYDVTQPKQPMLMGSFSPGGQAEEILVRDQYAYVAFYDDGLYILDISQPGQPREITHLATPGNARGLDIEGNTLFVADWLAGIHLVDISDPARAHITGGYDTDGAAWGVKAVNNSVYVLDWWGGFVVLDASDPARPVIASRYNRRDRIRQLADHGKYIIAASGTGGVQIFDISNPLNPTWITGVDFDSAATRLCVGDETVYVALEGGGIAIIDITDPFAARSVSRLNYNGAVKKMQIAGTLLYVLNDAAELAVFDVRDPKQPRFLNKFPEKINDFFLAENQRYVAITNREILTIDMSMPRHPRTELRLPTVDKPKRIAGNRNLAVVYNERRGFDIYTVDKSLLKQTGKYRFTDTVKDLAVANDMLLVNSGESGVMAIDLSNPAKPVLQSIYTLVTPVDGLILHQGTAYFDGSEAIIALQLLQGIAATNNDPMQYELSLPEGLPIGSYDLVFSSAEGAVDRARNILQVIMPRFSKPKFTMEDLKKAMEQRGATTNTK